MIIFFLLLFIGVPTLLVIVFRAISRWLYARNNPHLMAAWRIAGYAFVTGFAWIIIRAVWPGEDFYRDEFKENTGLSLPADTDFQSKSATYPDQHGDYQASALVILPDTAYQRLLTKIQRSERWHTMTREQLEQNGYMNELAILPDFTFAVEGGRRNIWFIIAFGSDGRTLYFVRHSS